MMKKFTEYLTESKHVYSYRIKIVGDVSKDTLKSLKNKLDQFDVISMSEPKTTPIMKKLVAFPDVENQTVTTIDVTFNYPATEPQIVQIATVIGINPNHIRLVTTAADDVNDKELQADNSNLLGSDYPDADKDQKKAKDEYANGNQQVVQNEYRSNFTIAGGKPPKAKTSNDYPQGTKSPVSGSNKRPVPKSAAR